MNKEDIRIVFMGTPEFAAGILDYLLAEGWPICGVVTAPDKPAGRGQKLRESAVKLVALKYNLPILQPAQLKNTAFLNDLAAMQADVQIVVAFRMLPEAVWRSAPLGTFNLHASLLPQYRGAAPINWAIINGETTTGVTTFFIDQQIDTGAIIYSIATAIQPKQTAGQLHDQLLTLGKQAVSITLEQIISNQLCPQKQVDMPNIRMAPKLNRENCKINWEQPGDKIEHLIRGLSPYPGAYTTITDEKNQWEVKIYLADFIPEQHQLPVGQLVINKSTMRIAVADGFLRIDQLQFPGKKAMKTTDLLNGMHFSGQIKAI